MNERIGADDAHWFHYAGESSDITPVRPIALAGYSDRCEPVGRVHSRLEANVVVLGTGATRVLFVALDVLFVGPEVTRAIQRCAGRFGLPASHVILGASHTHFAPATDQDKPLLGVVDEPWLHGLIEHLDSLVERVLTSTPARVRIVASRRSAPLNVNRRRRWPWPTLGRRGFRLRPSIVMAPNRAARCDTELEVLSLIDESQHTLALLWKYACHPVGLPDSQQVSAEFPGVVRQRARQVLGRHVPIIFWQGFAGDVRPDLDGPRGAKDVIPTMRRGPAFSRASWSQWNHWADQLADVMIDAVLRGPFQELTGPLEALATTVPMSDVIDPQLNQHLVERGMAIQRVSLGQDLEVLFVAAEVCSPFLELFRGNAPRIFAGYCGDVFGYLPSQSQVAEGGYEGGEFFSAFGLKGALRPGFQDSVMRAVKRISAFPKNGS